MIVQLKFRAFAFSQLKSSRQNGACVNLRCVPEGLKSASQAGAKACALQVCPPAWMDSQLDVSF
jgi:hypothetical protein